MNEDLFTRKCSATGAVVLAGLIALLALSSCRDDASSNADVDAHQPEQTTAAPTNRIDIPPSVRQNLGITFVKTEAGDVLVQVVEGNGVQKPITARMANPTPRFPHSH